MHYQQYTSVPIAAPRVWIICAYGIPRCSIRSCQTASLNWEVSAGGVVHVISPGQPPLQRVLCAMAMTPLEFRMVKLIIITHSSTSPNKSNIKLFLVIFVLSCWLTACNKSTVTTLTPAWTVAPSKTSSFTQTPTLTQPPTSTISPNPSVTSTQTRTPTASPTQAALESF